MSLFYILIFGFKFILRSWQMLLSASLCAYERHRVYFHRNRLHPSRKITNTKKVSRKCRALNFSLLSSFELDFIHFSYIMLMYFGICIWYLVWITKTTALFILWRVNDLENIFQKTIWTILLTIKIFSFVHFCKWFKQSFFLFVSIEMNTFQIGPHKALQWMYLSWIGLEFVSGLAGRANISKSGLDWWG